MISPDYTKLSYLELSSCVSDIWTEVKRRNPIFVNFYGGGFADAVRALVEIHECEEENPSSEAGPGIDPSSEDLDAVSSELSIKARTSVDAAEGKIPL